VAIPEKKLAIIEKDFFVPAGE